MQNLFSLDGTYYDLRILKLTRDGQVLDGPNAGRTLQGSMDRDIIGTYYNYTLEFDTSRVNSTQYDQFYEAVTDPNVDSHTLIVPYGQSVLTFDAYVTAAKDNLIRVDASGNKWSGLSLTFVAMSPQRRRT